MKSLVELIACAVVGGELVVSVTVGVREKGRKRGEEEEEEEEEIQKKRNES